MGFTASQLSVLLLRGVVPPLLLAALVLGEGPRILRAATEFVGAVRPGSRDAFTLSCHPVFGSCDLAAELADPRRELAPMCPCGGHHRQEMLAVASFIARGHGRRVPVASQSNNEYGHFVPNARLGQRQLGGGRQLENPLMMLLRAQSVLELVGGPRRRSFLHSWQPGPEPHDSWTYGCTASGRAVRAAGPLRVKSRPFPRNPSAIGPTTA
jgi:hypothetical protein